MLRTRSREEHTRMVNVDGRMSYALEEKVMQPDIMSTCIRRWNVLLFTPNQTRNIPIVSKQLFRFLAPRSYHRITNMTLFSRVVVIITMTQH